MNRHPTDLVSFVPGALFVAVAVTALAGGLRVDALDADWVWPVTLVALGIVVLVSSSLSTRSRDVAADAPDQAAGDDEHGDEAV